MTMSLRSKIVFLCLSVAILTSSLNFWSLTKKLHNIEDKHTQANIKTAVQFFSRELARLTDQLTYEACDYSRWDELYNHMPQVPLEWGTTNLSPSAHHGALKRETALLHDGRVIGRFARAFPGKIDVFTEKNVNDEGLLRLEKSPPGLAVVDNSIIFFAVDAIVRTDLSGPARGSLIAFRSLDDEIISYLAPIGWKLSIATSAVKLFDQEWTPSLQHSDLTLTKIHAVPGGNLAITLQQVDTLSSSMHDVVITSTLASVGLAMLAASLLGILLGWHWVDPIRRLAQACRMRDNDTAPTIPECAELAETYELSNELRRLIERDWISRQELTIAHEKIRGSLTAHRRFSAQLSHELKFPLHTLSGLISSLGTGKSCTAGDLISAQAALAHLETRLTDNARLAEPFSKKPHEEIVLVNVYAWMKTVTDSLTSAVDKKSIELTIESDLDSCYLNVNYLLPIMVHLLANAIQASPTHSIIRFCCRDNSTHIRFSFIDQGPGFSADSLPILRSACARRVVLPGEPGIGFGLSLVIERCAELDCSLQIPRSDASGTEIELNLKKFSES